MKHKTRKIFLCIGFLASLALCSCDMVKIEDHAPPKTGSREIDDLERDDLEKNGHFLKLVNLPLNTQLPNFYSVSVANSLSAIAKLNKDNLIFIYKEKDGEGRYTTCTVYLPLVYNDDKEFTETGYFYTAFSIHVDALTKYVVEVSDNFTVYYSDGRGQADVNFLSSPSSTGSKELTEKERDNMEKNGHYLKLVNLPPNAQGPNVFAVSVANSSSAIAKLNKNLPVSVFRESGSCTVYLPLVYNDDKDFLETGSFYTSFTIHIDALTSYIVSIADHYLVSFTDGRGQADVNDLPSPSSSGSRELTERERDGLEKTGRFLKLVNMPLHTQVPNVFSVSVANSSSAIAKLNKNAPVSIFRETDSDSCAVYLPLAYNDDKEFTETGNFYIAFSIHVDALTSYIVSVSDHFIVRFTDGRGQADINDIPSGSSEGSRELNAKERDDLEKTGRFLKLLNMPLHTQTPNFFSVSVSNSSSSIAKLNKNAPVSIFRDSNSCTVYLPLVYNDEKEFLETGDFFTSFTIHVDALTSYIVTSSDRFIVRFTDGRGQADINDIPSGSSEGSRELNAKERDDLEKTGRFLKIVNMPPHTQVNNVFSVSVSNSSSSIAKLNKNAPVSIFREDYSCTVYLPLAYNDDKEFTETGNFFASFSIHVDALVSYTVDPSDNFIVYFLDGRGQTDINDFPSAPVPPDPSYLTVNNLPSSVSVYNFSGVTVRNQTGVVASCKDYSQIILSFSNNKASAKIPLHYNSSDQIFKEYGAFFVLFDINVDVNVRYKVTVDDKLTVAFTNGNGSIDILSLPTKPEPPYLALKSFPVNSRAQQFSEVTVFTYGNSSVASGDLNNIIVKDENNLKTFLVPLMSGGSFFQYTGNFGVSFTINVDFENRISYKSSDLTIYFVNGSAVFDLKSFFGYFNASLENAADNGPPIVKSGSSFDVGGKRKTLSRNIEVSASLSEKSCVLYLYAISAESDVLFELSPVKPVYNDNKMGWYDGVKRALFKMLYIEGWNVYLFKTPFANPDKPDSEQPFPQFGQFVYNGYGFTSSTVVYSLSGSGNPSDETFTLEPGIYLIEVEGAGGGAGWAYNRTYPGGQGGFVGEIISLKNKTSFTAFTGSGGESAFSSALTSGTFNIVTTKNYYNYTTTTGGIQTSSLQNSNTVINAITISGGSSSMTGGGGGGGGSGSFVYSSSGNYLLLAGGGSGGAGGSYLTPGGGGGAGGTIGPGGGGGGSGSFYQTSSVGTGNFSAPGGRGGKGGGKGGGAGGLIAGSGGDASAVVLTSNTTVSGGDGAYSYSSSDFSSPSAPSLYVSSGAISGGSAASNTATSTRLFTVRTSFTFSGRSGSGGSSAANNSSNWRNTVPASASGASSRGLNTVYFTGSFSANGTNASTPGSYNSSWNNSNATFTSTLTLTIGDANKGRAGLNGGNNRDVLIGCGAESGGAGSVTVYKIY